MEEELEKKLSYLESVLYGEAVKGLTSALEEKTKKKSGESYPDKLNKILAYSIFLGSQQAKEEDEKYDLDQRPGYALEMKLINQRINDSGSRIKNEDIQEVLESLQRNTEKYVANYLQEYAQENNLDPRIAKINLAKEIRTSRLFYLMLYRALRDNSFAELGVVFKNCAAQENHSRFREEIKEISNPIKKDLELAQHLEKENYSLINCLREYLNITKN